MLAGDDGGAGRTSAGEIRGVNPGKTPANGGSTAGDVTAGGNA